jgi:superfamily II DNA or RNA helicase
MPKYRFSWDAFDDATVDALADAFGYADTDKPRTMPRREWLRKAAARPDEEFVSYTKATLIDVWLAGYNGAAEVVDELIGLGLGPANFRPRSPRGYAEFLHSTKNTKNFQRIVAAAMERYGDAGKTSRKEEELLRAFIPFTPSKQSRDTREPHEYQREAWSRLSDEYAKSEALGRFQGLVVMPTGSGKTFTATKWLTEQHVNQGGRVLWLAHRHELLEQAARAFLEAGSNATSRDKLRMRIVSGRHQRTHQIDPADDIVIASVQSLARRPDVTEQLLNDPKLFVVVDEAHHAAAKSYRDLVDKLTGRTRSKDATKFFRLLGLTATPTRTVESERSVLDRLFAGNVIYQLDIGKLIARGFLARPVPIHVKTSAEVEEGVTPRDREHAAKFNDLSEEWLARIAHMTQRNQLIVAEYLQNREKYGKTLIFAINVLHAKLLTDALRDQGISADFVASYSPDGQPIDNSAVVSALPRPLRLDGGPHQRPDPY